MAWPSEAGAIARTVDALACRSGGRSRSMTAMPPVRAVTGYAVKRCGAGVEVTVFTELAGVILYHWYVDGTYAGVTATARKTFWMETGEQGRVECIPSNDPQFDPIANAPEGWPARRRIWWIRSLSEVAKYRVDQKLAKNSWQAMATVPAVKGAWSYEVLTGRLLDLTEYQWRVIPIDADGQEGTAVTVDSEYVVRRPDAPRFTAAVDEDTEAVVISG